MGPDFALNFVLSLAGITLFAAAFFDARHYRIPNALVALLVALFPAYVFVAEPPLAWLNHVMVCAGLLLFGYLAFLKGWTGAGDAKLLAATGLWAGPKQAIVFVTVTALAGGALALILTVIAMLRTARESKDDAVFLPKTIPPVPYGVAIALGGACALALSRAPLGTQG